MSGLSIFGTGNGTSFPGGIFVGKATILAVEDISGEKVAYMQEACDIGLRLTLDIGRDFNPTMIFAGNFKQIGDKTDWGYAWKVKAFLKNIEAGLTNLTEDNRFPEGLLQDLVGKQFLRLTYTSGVNEEKGKVKYSDWGEIGSITEGEEVLHARFLKSLAKGHPKNYDKDARAKAETSFPAVVGVAIPDPVE